MPDNVTMTHPNLPGRSITVRVASAPHYKRSGWRLKSATVARPAAVRLTKSADTKSEPPIKSDDQSADTKEN